MNNIIVNSYIDRVAADLFHNILPFWIKYATDIENGGYYGLISNDLKIDRHAPKGSIQNSRILWTYSSAYRLCGNPIFLMAAKHAFEFLSRYMLDKKYGGVYMLVDYTGKPFDNKKFCYAHAFVVYGLSEYYRAAKDEKALSIAKDIYGCMETYFHDKEKKGYIEAAERDWSDTDNFSLGADHRNEKKSMNNHLHVMEAYTNLFRVWKDEGLKERLNELIKIACDYILDKETYHFNHFFDENWNVKSDSYTYGHDIEGSWLLFEAAEVLGNKDLIDKIGKIAVKMAEAVYNEGIASDGGIFYEGSKNGIIKDEKHWWPQAEAFVGFLNAYELSGDDKFLKTSVNCWDFIENNLIDKDYGEWFWGVGKNNTRLDMEKGGPWKAPYHNSRACMEFLERCRMFYPDKINEIYKNAAAMA